MTKLLVIMIACIGNISIAAQAAARPHILIILADDLDLARERMVTAHRFDGTSTILGVQDPEHPERGKIALIFTGPEPQLRQWVIEDQNGDQTVVVLNDFITGNELGDSLFNIILNTERRENR